MKLWQIVGGAAALTITLAGCAQKECLCAHRRPVTRQLRKRRLGPAVTGSVIYVSAAPPPDAVLTATLSDASLADAAASDCTARGTHCNRRRSAYALPYNPSDIQPNAYHSERGGDGQRATDVYYRHHPKWSTATAPVPICCWFRVRCADSGCANRHAVITAVQQVKSPLRFGQRLLFTSASVRIEIDRAVRRK